MDTTRFIRNFILFKEALQKQNFNNKELNTTSMQAALQCEQLALSEQAQDLQSEQVRAKMQIGFLSMQANLPKTNALKPLAFSYGDTRRNAFRRANME